MRQAEKNINYETTQKEIQKAEDMMTDEQREASRKREKMPRAVYLTGPDGVKGSCIAFENTGFQVFDPERMLTDNAPVITECWKAKKGGDVIEKGESEDFNWSVRQKYDYEELGIDPKGQQLPYTIIRIDGPHFKTIEEVKADLKSRGFYVPDGLKSYHDQYLGTEEGEEFYESYFDGPEFPGKK